MVKSRHKIIDVTHKGKTYSVVQITYKGNDVPVVLDKTDATNINNSSIKLRCDDFCNIFCSSNNKYIKLNQKLLGNNSKEIVNINGIGFDNRRENIREEKFSKRVYPANIHTLPYYIWYTRGDKTHGDRFVIKLHEFKWSTTSSKKLTTEAKLEQAKEKMILLRKERPELFVDTLIDQEHIKERKKLLKSFYKIIYRAGFTNVKRLVTDSNGNLITGYKLSRKDRLTLKSLKITSVNSIPKKSCLEIDVLPKYVFYRKPYNNRGSYFAIENHPSLTKIWRTTTSKKVSDQDKFNEMMTKYSSIH